MEKDFFGRESFCFPISYYLCDMKTAKMTFCMTAAVFLLQFMSISCTRSDSERVRLAAEKDYEYLKEGRYEDFVSEIAYADSMSEDYRAQMVDLVQEYAETLNRQHGGFSAIAATNDTIIGDQAHVFLQVTFADSTSEEVGLPMVRVDKEWKMQ